MAYMGHLPAVIKAVSKKLRRSPRCHFRNDQRAAVLRALTGADLVRKAGLSLEEAAIRSGSCIAYVRAAVTLREADGQGWGNEAWINQVIRGEIPILQAAKLIEPQVQLIRAYKRATPTALRVFYRVTRCTSDLTTLLIDATPAERTKAAWVLGTEAVWNDMIEPLMKNVPPARPAQ